MPRQMIFELHARRKYQHALDRHRAPAASFLKFCSAVALSRSSHNTLPSIAFSSRIHTSNTSGVIFQLLLNEQKTKPRAGNPTSARAGVRSAICRRRSFG